MRFLIAAAALIAVSETSLANQTRAPAAPTSQVTVQTVAEGLDHPWGFEFLPDGRILVTERDGRMRIVSTDGRLSQPVAGVPEVFAQGQGGLLDVALAPDFETSGTIYFSFSEPRRDGNGTAVARARLNADVSPPRLEDVQVIFHQQPSYRRQCTFWLAHCANARWEALCDLGRAVSDALRAGPLPSLGQGGPHQWRWFGAG
jgi:Glucose/sorbosone dehydrogenases